MVAAIIALGALVVMVAVVVRRALVARRTDPPRLERIGPETWAERIVAKVWTLTRRNDD